MRKNRALIVTGAPVSEQARRALLGGDAAGAARIASQALADDPTDASLALLVLDAYAALGREADALPFVSETLRRSPAADALLWRVAVARHRAGDLDAAVLDYETLQRRQPSAGLFYNLGLAYQALGRLEAAAASFERALVLDAAHADSHMALATVQEERGQIADALTHYAEATRLHPSHWIAHHNRGWLLRRIGDAAGALESLQSAVAAAPTAPEAQFALGTCLAALDRNQEACAPLERAVALRPDYPEALANLGAVYRALRHPRAAVEVLRKSLGLAADQPVARNNLAMCYRDLGMIKEMLRELDLALRLRPDDPEIHSNRIFNLQYDASATGETLLAEGRAWEAKFAPSSPPTRQFARPAGSSRLKIGYLSPDFRNHAAGFFLEPLITSHDHENFEIVCYFDHLAGDDVTERVRASVPHWRQSRSLSDSALGDAIRADGVDILVECGGHTGGNRLAVLAQRAAPVQVTTLLGHGGTTGLSAIDYILADAILAPESFERHFSEQIVRLPFFAPFRPRASWPQVSPLPAGGPVFACVADPARISGEIMEVWRDLLMDIPHAQLVLKHWVHGEADLQDHWRERYAMLGERCRWEGLPGGWGANMDFYEQVWAVLDTWPANGASSSLIPMWMGVPVVSLSGRHCGQRFGASLLTAAGLPELVAETPADYCRIAAGLVSEPTRLDTLRYGLRERIAGSLICDGVTIVRALEEAYRGMWRRWCDRASVGGPR